MSAVEALCTRVIRLKDGEAITQGDVREQIRDYLNSMQERSEVSFDSSVAIGPNLTLRNFEFLPNPIASGDKQEFKIEIASNQADRIDSLVILVYSALGHRVAIMDLRSGVCPFLLGDDSLKVTGRIESLPLVQGQYQIGLYIESSKARGNYTGLAKVTVIGSPGSSKVVPYPANVRGFVELTFETQLGPKAVPSEQTSHAHALLR